MAFRSFVAVVRTVPTGFDLGVTARDIDWNRPIHGGPLAHGFDYYFGVNIPKVSSACANSRFLPLPPMNSIGLPCGSAALCLFAVDISVFLRALCPSAVNSAFRSGAALPRCVHRVKAPTSFVYFVYFVVIDILASELPLGFAPANTVPPRTFAQLFKNSLTVGPRQVLRS